jgi:hypothetical protein
MAIVFAVVFIGLALFFSVNVFYQALTTPADEQSTFYGVNRSLAVTSLCLMIGFVVAGIAKKEGVNH